MRFLQELDEILSIVIEQFCIDVLLWEKALWFKVLIKGFIVYCPKFKSQS